MEKRPRIAPIDAIVESKGDHDDDNGEKEEEDEGREEEEDDDEEEEYTGPPQCTCGWHVLCSVERLLSLNTSSRTTMYHDTITRIQALLSPSNPDPSANSSPRPTRWLDIGDGSMLALMAASVGGCVTSLEAKPLSSLLFSQILENNPTLSSRVDVVSELDDQDCDYDVIMAEPFFYQMSNLPLWQALSFWFGVAIFFFSF